MKNNHPLSIWLACNFILSQNHLQYTHIISSYAKCRRRAPAESIWMDRWSFLSFISFTFFFCLSTSPRLMGLTPFNNNFRNKFPFSATVKPFWNSHIFHLRSFVFTFHYLLQPSSRRVMNRDEYKTKTYRASSSHLPFHIISISIKNNNCASSECPRVCVCARRVLFVLMHGNISWMLRVIEIMQLIYFINHFGFNIIPYSSLCIFSVCIFCSINSIEWKNDGVETKM